MSHSFDINSCHNDFTLIAVLHNTITFSCWTMFDDLKAKDSKISSLDWSGLISLILET